MIFIKNFFSSILINSFHLLNVFIVFLCEILAFFRNKVFNNETFVVLHSIYMN